MNTHAVSLDINQYCVSVEKSEGKTKCSYCGKFVSGLEHLRSHLAGMWREHVSPCDEVPLNVMQFFKKELLEKRSHLRKKVGSLDHSNISSCKRSKSHHQSNDIEIETIDIQDVDPSEQNQSLASVIRNTSLLTTLECSEAQPGPTQESIARIFYESGIDINPANLCSVKKVLDSIIGSEQMDNNIIMPSSSMMEGKFLQDEVKQMHEYVNKIRDSWTNTGCSILLDGWFDENGRKLVNILVECPQGPVYLRSDDISDDNALEICLDEVIADIGVEDVIQIITYTGSPNMKVVGEKFMEKYPNIFWTVSASHCIELMLEKMQRIGMINNVLIKARTITKFIYNCAEILKLMRNTGVHNLVKSSRSKFAGCFLTLENIVSEEENLKRMFTSSEWITSSWASSTEGKEVADLVADQSFWEDAWIVTRGTIPVVRVLELINEKDIITVGTIYETIDQVKETIKKEFHGREFEYMQFWSIIDEIWDTPLHNPLHAAGYFLNPCLFYSADFFNDMEVSGGLLCCIVRMEKSEFVQDAISMQLDEYQESNGGFGEGISYDRRTNILPSEWWSTYGGECPELQKLAVRILSQTCSGASRYQLKRTLAEKMLKNGQNWEDEKRLTDLTFVHYNLHLKNVISGIDSSNALVEEIDVLNDKWFAETEEYKKDI
ncbi:uncharacterized protein LOC124935188 [Impatiens glandulifera]|uniref:uncharacterized protein LOC124935188 n=1 Tax=Impatiens glandulifera TaxID=253017 RepID=UPI001FB09154|nr:uncharacterized protein LOC124935188 [Impatiens glandulifera]